MKTKEELNKIIEPQEAKKREEEEATIRKTLAEKANELLDKVLHPEPVKAEQKPTELASASEIAEVVHAANPTLDLTAFDRAERDYSLYMAKVNLDGANSEKIVLSRMANAFPEVPQSLFAPGSSHERTYFVQQIAYNLNQLAMAKTKDIMASHVEPLQKLFAQIIPDILEAAADAQIEQESTTFKIAESARQSAERAVFDAGARQRFLKGHDDHKFEFRPKVFIPSSLPARLLATAARLRQFKYVPGWGMRPSSAPLHGLLAQALLNHPAK
jgi:hypothetical protein